MQANLRIDCRAWQGELPRIWASIGYDEINWTYTPRGKALYRTLRELAEVPYAVRNHNALTSGNGLSQPAWGATNVYHEKPDGTPAYDWTLIDQVYDTMVGAGFHPLVELGFMPIDLVPAAVAGADWGRDVGHESYEADGVWKNPPKDYTRWGELVHQLVRHCVERYGPHAVEKWRWELWNEPNLPNYWRGTCDDYLRLYDHTVAGATRALPSVQVGGPATSNPASTGAEFLERFLAHCVSGTNAVTGATGTRLDFVSFHTKGAYYTPRRQYNPHLPLKRECPSSAAMLNDIRAGLETVARFPALSGVPVLVDECDPAVGTIYGVWDNPNFNFNNTEYYANFTGALVKRILDLNRQYPNPIALMTSWAFYFEGKRYFEGNRTLVTNENIEKPVLNSLRALGRLGTTRVGATSDGARDVLQPDAPADEVDALAAVAGDKVTALIWYQADEWWREGAALVHVQFAHVPFAGPAVLRRYQIDGRHSNAYAEWVAQGRPQDPSPAQIERLRARQGLELFEPPHSVQVGADGSLALDLELPLFGTVLLEIEPAAAR